MRRCRSSPGDAEPPSALLHPHRLGLTPILCKGQLPSPPGDTQNTSARTRGHRTGASLTGNQSRLPVDSSCSLAVLAGGGEGGGGRCDGFVISPSASEGDSRSSKESVLRAAAAPGVLPASTLLRQGDARGLAPASCCFPSSVYHRVQSPSGHVVNILKRSRGKARGVRACLQRSPGGRLLRCALGSALGGRYPQTQLAAAWGSGAGRGGCGGEAELLPPANLLASLRQGGWGGLSSSPRPRAGERGALCRRWKNQSGATPAEPPGLGWSCLRSGVGAGGPAVLRDTHPAQTLLSPA